jgi:hypothetical protein
MSDMTVAMTILDQLGGHKFRVMTGAKNFIGAENSLSFTLPGGGGFTKHGINHVKVILTPRDTYDMQFYRVRKSRGLPTLTQVTSFSDVYFDQLQELFTKATGLVTSLGTMTHQPNGVATIPLSVLRNFNNKAED